MHEWWYKYKWNVYVCKRVFIWNQHAKGAQVINKNIFKNMDLELKILYIKSQILTSIESSPKFLIKTIKKSW